MALSQYKRIEIGFDLDNFAKPIAYSGTEAWTRQILQLALMEPGSIPSNPSIGIGMKRYDFLLEEDRYKLAAQINEQVPKFFPDMPFSRCSVSLPDDDQDQDIIYLLLTFNSSASQSEVVVVAVAKRYNYIDFAIAM